MKKISKAELIHLIRRPNVKRVGFGKTHENVFTVMNHDDFIFELKTRKDRHYCYQEDNDGIVFVNKYRCKNLIAKTVNNWVVEFKRKPWATFP